MRKNQACDYAYSLHINSPDHPCVRGTNDAAELLSQPSTYQNNPTKTAEEFMQYARYLYALHGKDDQVLYNLAKATVYSQVAQYIALSVPGSTWEKEIQTGGDQYFYVEINGTRCVLTLYQWNAEESGQIIYSGSLPEMILHIRSEIKRIGQIDWVVNLTLSSDRFTRTLNAVLADQ